MAFASGGATVDRWLEFFVLIGEIESGGVARGAVPGPLSVKYVGSDSDRIQTASGDVNQKTIPSGALHPSSNKPIQNIFSY
jgi:hypothetical protein